LPALAQAQEVSPAEHDAAVTNFQAGRRFVEQNNCKDAIPRFLESLKHEQNVGARFNLAECSRKEGREVDAWNQYKGAEQLAIQKNDPRKDDARKAINELEPKVTKLRLVLPPNAETVKIDGRVVEKTDFNLLETGYALSPNDPHAIEVTGKNRAPWTKADVKGPAGAELPAMTVDLGAPLVPEGADPNEGNGQRLAGMVVGAVGIAGVAVGTIFGVVALGKKSTYNSDVESRCQDPKNCNPQNQPTLSDERTQISGPATISTIAFIAGGALLATGAVVYFTAPRAPSTSAARIHFMPAVGPATAGAMLGGTF
jgi:hypothetical protein